MKIVQLITAFQLGGAEKVAIDIARNIDSNIFQSQFLTIFKDNSEFSTTLKNKLDDHAIPYEEQGISSKYHKFKYIGLLIATIQTFFFLVKNKPDVIHSHTDLPDFVLSNVMKIYSFLNLKKPMIVRTIHNTQLWSSHKKIACYVEKSFYNDSVVFISKGAKNAYFDLRKECNLSISNNTFFISNGIDINNYTNHCGEHALKQNNIILSKDKVNFLFVGRFVEQKGFDLMLEAFSLIEPSLLKSIEMVAFGSGPLEKLVYNKEYSNLPLKIFPPTANLQLLYGCFDFLIMPSRFEGLGLVALESLASQLPVIASNAPGLIEAVPEKWPLKFENENVYEMQKIITKVIKNEIDVSMLADSGQKFVKENFNLDTMVQKYSDIYARG